MTSENPSIEAVELNFYRILASFTQAVWTNPDSAEEYSKKLSDAADQLLNNNFTPSDDVVSHLAITINALLCPIHEYLHPLEQRSIPIRSKYDYIKLQKAFPILYDILRRFGFNRIHRQIDGSYFCKNSEYLFICPRRPPLKKYQYTHQRFQLPTDSTPKKIPFKYLQHVVHNMNDVMSILNLIGNQTVSSSNKTQNIKPITAEFLGGPNHAYHGPDMIWFAPLPSEQVTYDSMILCPSLDCKNSSYGCYRFSIPFQYFLQYQSYILGTRNYEDEHCHTIMLVDPNVKSVKFINEIKSLELTDTGIIEREPNEIYEWLCYRDKKEAWDQLDFAVAATRLELDPIKDKIRLDFVDHKDCMREKYLRNGPVCTIRSRQQAMEQFLLELNNNHIELGLLKPFFDDQVYRELQGLGIHESTS